MNFNEPVVAVVTELAPEDSTPNTYVVGAFVNLTKAVECWKNTYGLAIITFYSGELEIGNAIRKADRTPYVSIFESSYEYLKDLFND